MALRQGFRKILVAIDGSEVALRAAEHAVRIARQDGGQLFALHVVQSPSSEMTGELGEYYNIARRDAKKWLKEVETLAESHGVPVKTDTIVGAFSVVDTLIGYAESSSVELIVSGTRGRTPSSRMRLGSVASGLVEYSSCAVLVVR